MSLKQPTMKMSKSHEDPRSRILINDSFDEIKTKIRLAMTDSLPGISYEPTTRPGVSNLLSILSNLDSQNRSCEELAKLHSDSNLRELKDQVCETINRALSDIRAKFDQLVRRHTFLDEVAQQGGNNANAEAQETMVRVRKAMGLS